MSIKLFYYIGVTVLLIAPQLLLAQYDVASIPEELKKDAHVVIRNSTTDWVISSPKDAKMKKREVVTFLSEKAENRTLIELHYDDDLLKISNISVKFYDKYGRSFGKAKSRAFTDLSTGGGFQIDNSRAKVLDFSGLEYPFTYELEYEIKYKGIISIQPWAPIVNYYTSLEKSSISVKSKKGYKVKYKEENLKVSKKEEGEEEILEWNIGNFPAIKLELYGSDLWEKIPYLELAPLDFELDGYAGSNRSWNDFGKWYNSILDDTEKLSDEAKKEVRSLITEEMTDVEKIKTLYQYLQDNSRYVSIQLGIGGFKPFEPDFIHEKKYGDCKALSYYTQEMLDAVGIKSNLVLVNAGRYATKIDPDFPSNQFNHVFLCVPQQKDTIWLECTSQTVPFGFMGYHTSDRNVLVINDEGAELKRTPKYSKKDNIVATKAKITLDATGASTGEIHQDFDGLEYERSALSWLINKPEKMQKDWIKDYYDISNFEILEYNLNKGKDNHLGELNTNVQMDKFASTIGKRMFFKPIVTNRFNGKIEKPEERKTKFDISDTYTHSGVYEYEIPTGFEVEKNVKETNIDTQFGAYSLNAKPLEGNKIIIERKFELNDGEYEAEEFVAFAEFLKKVRKADRQKVALVMTKEP